MARRLLIVIFMGSLGIAAWQLGQAAWILAKAELAQVLIEGAWARALRDGGANRPWPWADTWPVAHIEFPRLDEHALILHGSGGAALPFGPGFVSDSAPPGARGVSIIGGHRDTHFSFLRHVRVGDEIKLRTAVYGDQIYRVSDARVIDARYAMLDDDENDTRIALVTCYPFDALRAGGDLRYVVTARLEADTGNTASAGRAKHL